MIINKQQLITLLVKKSGLSEQEIEAQLSQLISQIQRAAEEGKSLEIDGLGTFFMEDDDSLNFTPTEQLETEINNKYAGMKPIELIGSFEESDSTEEDEVEDVFAFEKQKLDQKQQPTSFELETDSNDDLPPLDSEKKEEKEKDNDPIGKILVAAVIVISIAVTGWVSYDLFLREKIDSWGTKSTQQTFNNPIAEVSSKSVENTETENNEITPAKNVGEQESKTGVRTDEEDRDGEQVVYGLRGTPSDSITEGYSIIVFSQRTLSAANKNKRQLEQSNFRVTISRANVNGRQYYRVALGQFESLEAAKEAVKKLPEPYRSENFIQKINYQ